MSENVIFKYDLKFYKMSNVESTILLNNDGYIQNYNGLNTGKPKKLNNSDFLKIKSLLKDMCTIGSVGDDYTRDPKYFYMDGSYINIEVNYDGINKELNCVNQYQYLDDPGLSPSADKLITLIKGMNEILDNYNCNLSLGSEEDL